MTRVSMACPEPPVTRDSQDTQDHQANQELVVMAQVLPDPQVFPGPPAQRERKVTQAYRATAQKEAPATLDNPDPPALPDLRALQVVPVVSPILSLESPDLLAPEESWVKEDRMATEVIPVPVTASEEAPRGIPG